MKIKDNANTQNKRKMSKCVRLLKGAAMCFVFFLTNKKEIGCLNRSMLYRTVMVLICAQINF